MKPTAYGGFIMSFLLSKVEDIYTFKPTNLHQNAVKKHSKICQI